MAGDWREETRERGKHGNKHKAGTKASGNGAFLENSVKAVVDDSVFENLSFREVTLRYVATTVRPHEETEERSALLPATWDVASDGPSKKEARASTNPPP